MLEVGRFLSEVSSRPSAASDAGVAVTPGGLTQLVAALDRLPRPDAALLLLGLKSWQLQAGSTPSSPSSPPFPP